METYMFKTNVNVKWIVNTSNPLKVLHVETTGLDSVVRFIFQSLSFNQD